jgi:hypothetical protein
MSDQIAPLGSSGNCTACSSGSTITSVNQMTDELLKLRVDRRIDARDVEGFINRAWNSVLAKSSPDVRIAVYQALITEVRIDRALEEQIGCWIADERRYALDMGGEFGSAELMVKEIMEDRADQNEVSREEFQRFQAGACALLNAALDKGDKGLLELAKGLLTRSAPGSDFRNNDSVNDAIHDWFSLALPNLDKNHLPDMSIFRGEGTPPTDAKAGPPITEDSYGDGSDHGASAAQQIQQGPADQGPLRQLPVEEQATVQQQAQVQQQPVPTQDPVQTSQQFSGYLVFVP